MNNKKELPDWLNGYIFNRLGAEEKPDPKEFCKNLHSDDAKNKIYLGTYFPRSFAESYCIHDNLFTYEPYRRGIAGKSKMTMLSVGCGTGGDVLGALCAMAENLPEVNEVEIVLYDGNNIAIDYLTDLVNLEPLKSRLNPKLNCVPLPITSKADLEHYMKYIGEGYDIITSFKFVNEIMEMGVLKRDGFKVLTELLAPKLTETGLMTMLDVTDIHLGVWQPKNLNGGLSAFSKEQAEFNTLLPIPCHFYDTNCRGGNCFTNKLFYGTFTAEDKVTYRVIGRTAFVNYLYSGMKAGNAYVRNKDNETCPQYSQGKRVDGFDINN